MIAIIAFVVALLLLVLVHEYGHFQASRWLGVGVEEFGFGFPPAAWKRRIGKTLISINWLPLGGFVRLKGEEDNSNDPDSFSAQAPWRRAVIVLAGVFMNIVLAVVLFSIGYGIGMPQRLPDMLSPHANVRDIQHIIVGVLEESPAATVFKPGDQIITLDGKSFVPQTDLQSYIRSHDPSPIEVKYLRDGETKTASLATAQLRVVDGQEVRGFGVELDTSAVISYAWYYAPIAGTQAVWNILGLIASTIWTLITSIFVRAPVSTEVTGPLGIAILSGQVAAAGALAYLQFVAILSINLAFVNILPVPALDGGRLLFIIIEWVRGKAVSPELERRIHAWGFSILIFLVLVVTVHDVSQYFGSAITGVWDSLRSLL